MTTPTRPSSSRRQTGLATLFMTLVLLLIAGLVLLYTSRGAVMEQRLSANEIRTKQAFAAANAGIEHAFSYMLANGIDQDGNGVADTLGSVTLTNASMSSATTATYYTVKYCDPAAAQPACPASHATALAACTAPADPKDVIVVSCGWSDDDTAVHKVTQRIGGTPGLAGDIPNPLISRGTANLLVGGASILNFFSDLTVWSGGSTIGQSMTGKSFVRDTVNYPEVYDSSGNTTANYRNTGNSPGCNNPPTGYTCSTQGSTMGHDVIMSDTRLATASTDQFFQMFFGATPADYRDHSAGWVVDTNNSLSGEDSTSINSVYNVNSQTQHQNIWLEGNVTINGEIGTQANPVVLIVDGSLDLGANAVINGVVYSRDAVNSTGTPTIYGSLITGSNANTVGNLKVIYDPFKGKGLAESGKATKLQGSWKDW